MLASNCITRKNKVGFVFLPGHERGPEHSGPITIRLHYGLFFRGILLGIQRAVIFSTGPGQEPKPKLLLGFTCDYNDKGPRAKGASSVIFYLPSATWRRSVPGCPLPGTGVFFPFGICHPASPDGAVIPVGNGNPGKVFTGTGFNWQGRVPV